MLLLVQELKFEIYGDPIWMKIYQNGDEKFEMEVFDPIAGKYDFSPKVFHSPAECVGFVTLIHIS